MKKMFLSIVIAVSMAFQLAAPVMAEEKNEIVNAADSGEEGARIEEVYPEDQTSGEAETVLPTTNDEPVEAASVADSGACGEKLTWVLDSTGVLTISGTGPMYEYLSSNAPWGSSETEVRNILIEEGVTSIGAYAFCSSTSTSISIPDGVTSIGEAAFACSAITSITLPDSVTSIGRQAFFNSALTGITIPSGVTNIAEYTFAWSAITSLTLSEGVTSIEEGAFLNCDDLTSVAIPKSLQYIEADAFGCSGNVREIYISDVAAWCNITFENEYSHPNWGKYEEVNGYVSLYLNDQLVTDLIIPDGVTAIPPWLFNGCGYLTSVTIAESVTGIGDWAFLSCDGLTSMTILPTVKSIGDHAIGMAIDPYDGSCYDLDEVIIWGYKASTAYRYAMENGIGFGALTPLRVKNHSK